MLVCPGNVTQMVDHLPPNWEQTRAVPLDVEINTCTGVECGPQDDCEGGEELEETGSPHKTDRRLLVARETGPHVPRTDGRPSIIRD